VHQIFVKLGHVHPLWRASHRTRDWERFQLRRQASQVVNDDLHFQYKIHGLEMDWETFKPIFLPSPDAAAKNDLANVSTWGWQPQAALSGQNIAMVSVGLEKYIGSAEAGVDVVKSFLK
jgi:hypothetical protein